MAKMKSGVMSIVDLAIKVGFKHATCLCGECKSEFPTAELGAVRATLKDEKPMFDLLCVECTKGEPFADVTVPVTDTIDKSEFEFLLADMNPCEINIWVRVVPH